MSRSIKLSLKTGKKLFPILSTILLCCCNDIALRGKESDSGNLCDLLQFRVEAGYTILEEHLMTAVRNAKYTSVRVQNELISLSEEVIPSLKK